MWAGIRLVLGLTAALHAIDDISYIWKWARLGAALLPFSYGENPDGLCELCDFVIADKLVSGSNGLKALPCSLICLRVERCIRMCETVKLFSHNVSQYPCVAAGYCADHSIDPHSDELQCMPAPPFRCVPSSLCERRWNPVRKGLGFTCGMKPGLSHWVGMRSSVRRHAGAIVTALFAQPRCGEAGAGEWCIAEPRGIGAIAETAGLVLSLAYGGMRTVYALETPGGDDDRQWLTFWMMAVLLTSIERLTRVVLSWCPRYYEAKLLLLCWLLYANGADRLYRVLRRWLKVFTRKLGLRSNPFQAGATMASAAAELERIPPAFVEMAVAAASDKEKKAARAGTLRSRRSLNTRSSVRGSMYDNATDLAAVDETKLLSADAASASRASLRGSYPGSYPGSCPESYPGSRHSRSSTSASQRSSKLARRPVALRRLETVELVMQGLREQMAGTAADSREKLRLTYHWLLSPEGTAALYSSSLSASERASLHERAAASACFDPRFLQLHLLGVTSAPEGELPSFSTNGSADSYLVCYLVDPNGQRYPKDGVASRVCYRTTRPAWRQSKELALRGGYVTPSGYFCNEQAEATGLVIEAYDARVGFWGWALYLSELLAMAVAAWAILLYGSGALDSWSPRGHELVYLCVAASLVAVVATALAHVRFRADDALIGVTRVTPLAELLDQKVHQLQLALHRPKELKEEEGEGEGEEEDDDTPRNKAGTLGVLDVACSYTEY